MFNKIWRLFFKHKRVPKEQFTGTVYIKEKATEHRILCTNFEISLYPSGLWFRIKTDENLLLNPLEKAGVLIVHTKKGIGIFNWSPHRKNSIVSGFKDNVQHCKDIIRNEEQKAFDLLDRGDKIISKHLKRCLPTEEDYKFLWETCGLHRSFVDEYIDANKGDYV